MTNIDPLIWMSLCVLASIPVAIVYAKVSARSVDKAHERRRG